MKVEQIASLFRRLVDDPDTTAFPSSAVADALQQGYREFRDLVSNMRPDQYVQSYTTTSPTKTLDLNNVLFGATPTQPRALRIVRVLQDGYEIPARGSTTALEHEYDGWALKGRVLTFGTAPGNIQIDYIPADTINWAAGIIPASNIYVDDLESHHDIIALLACRQYYALDFAENPVVQAQLSKRLNDLKAFLTAQQGDSYRYVQEA